MAVKRLFLSTTDMHLKEGYSVFEQLQPRVLFYESQDFTFEQFILVFVG